MWTQLPPGQQNKVNETSFHYVRLLLIILFLIASHLKSQNVSFMKKKPEKKRNKEQSGSFAILNSSLYFSEDIWLSRIECLARKEGMRLLADMH